MREKEIERVKKWWSTRQIERMKKSLKKRIRKSKRERERKREREKERESNMNKIKRECEGDMEAKEVREQ